MNYDDCTTALTDKTIVVEERGKRFIVANLLRKTISKTQVDGCLFDETHEKCDWIISYANGKVKVAFFIELKGTDTEQGLLAITCHSRPDQGVLPGAHEILLHHLRARPESRAENASLEEKVP